MTIEQSTATSLSFKPVIALVGRPNVGKSTLFNVMTKSRDALVANVPGLTRDRIYGEGQEENFSYIVVDTGGIGEEHTVLDNKLSVQAWLAIEEADLVLFLVDARAGLSSADENIATQLRLIKKPVLVVVNKIDGLDERTVGMEFYSLGLGKIECIAASHKRGVKSLLQSVFNRVVESSQEKIAEQNNLMAIEASFEENLELEKNDSEQNNSEQNNSEKSETESNGPIRIAIVGRPNVGKSTLVNRILGEERVIVHDMPGTTRDSIYIPFTRQDHPYILIDTAGVRRRARVYQTIEKFSIIKSLQAISDAAVVVYVIDSQEGVTDQDLHLLGFVVEAGKALVIAMNKWDHLTLDQKNKIKRDFDLKLSFVDFAKIHKISALHGTGVGELFPTIEKSYESAARKLETSRLTTLLEQAISRHQPPLVKGRRIKLRYAHAGGNFPPTIVIHGNQTDLVPDSYSRYLNNFFRKALKISGTPLKIIFKTGKNPFVEGKKK